MNRCASGGIILSSLVTRYQLGLLFHAACVTLPVTASSPHGTCDSAMNAAVFASTSPANAAGNLALSRNRKPSRGGRIGGCGPPAGKVLISASTDWPLSGAKAAMYTSAATLGSLPASVITAPPYECPTRITGPGCASITLFVVATSPASEIVGFWTMATLYPSLRTSWNSPSQPDPSTNPPWTRTIVGRASAVVVPPALLSRDVRCVWACAACALSANAATRVCCFMVSSSGEWSSASHRGSAKRHDHVVVAR